MTEPRSGKNSHRGSGWKKRKKDTGIILRIVLRLPILILVLLTQVSAWEEGDDAVNVISIENMDALLGLRMVTELKSFEGVKTNESEITTLDDWKLNSTESDARSRRMVNPNTKAFWISAQIADLCSTTHCHCNHQNLQVVCDFQNQEVDLKPGSIPSRTRTIELGNAKRMHVPPGTFHHLPKLESTLLRAVHNLTISNSAFQNISTSHFRLLIKDCTHLTVEDHSFRNLKNPLHMSITNCEHVILKKSIMYGFREVQILNVPNLKLVENTFSSEMKQNLGSTETQMLFHTVTVNEIPNATFPLSSAKIQFFNCTIGRIKGGAFNGIALASVLFVETKIDRLQSGAFSERTLIQNVEFDGVVVGHVESNALSAAAKFTIQNSRIEEMTNRAFNVNTAFLKLLNNHFEKIRRYAFEIHNWNSIMIEGNRFKNIEPDFFSAPYSNITTVRTEFTFLNNSLGSVGIDVLAFVPNETGLDVLIQNNTFEDVCHCHLESWMRERSGDSWESFYETSFCVISDLLEKCYNISKGYMNMKEYMEDLCTPENMVVCEDVGKTYRPNILIPLDMHNTERTVLGVIFLGVVCSIAIMITILSLMWIKEKGICKKKRKSNLPKQGCFSMCSQFCDNGNLVSSDSISRVNIQQYAEIQNQLNQQQKQTSLTIEEDLSDDEELIVYETKATQTIPEELTQELIQSLKEKLADPENHNEARDMIEHLYDLIKVEESCNNNNASPTTSLVFDDDEELGGIYEVIQTKSSTLKNSKNRRKSPGTNVVSTGTKAPSPDKLSPVNFNKRRPLPTIVSDYVEPRDRKSNEYCELPSANLIMPDVLASSQIKDNPNLQKTHIYAEPLQSAPRSPPPMWPTNPGTSNSLPFHKCN